MFKEVPQTTTKDSKGNCWAAGPSPVTPGPRPSTHHPFLLGYLFPSPHPLP